MILTAEMPCISAMYLYGQVFGGRRGRELSKYSADAPSWTWPRDMLTNFGATPEQRQHNQAAELEVVKACCSSSDIICLQTQAASP